MCFCKVEKSDHDEELVVPNRPRRQASQRRSPSSQLYGRRNLSMLPRGLEPLGADQSYPRRRRIELRRSVSQDRIVLVETITPRSSGPTADQRPCLFGERPLPKALQRETRPLSIAESNGQLESRLIHSRSPRQSNGMVAVITSRQSGSVGRRLIQSGG